MDIDFCATPELMNLPSASAKRSKQFVDQETQAAINDNLFQLKREVKTLRQKIKRRNLKLSNMKKVIKKISKKGLRSENVKSVEDIKMVSCVVDGCINNTSTDDPTVEYFPFPKIKDLLNIWIKACGLEKKTVDINEDHICYLHFEEETFITELIVDNGLETYSRTLAEDAVPTLYLPEIQNTDGEMVFEYGYSTPYVSELPVSSQDHFVNTQGLSTPRSSIEMEINTEFTEEGDNKIYIKSKSDLERLKAENEILDKKIRSLKMTILEIRDQLNVEEKILTVLNMEYDRKAPKHKMESKNEQRSILYKVFSKSQVKDLTRKTKTRWSDDDMAVAFTIRHLSNRKCYQYLTKKMHIPLPGLSSIQRWVPLKRNKKTKSK